MPGGRFQLLWRQWIIIVWRLGADGVSWCFSSDIALSWLCRTWRVTWTRREDRSLWVAPPPPPYTRNYSLTYRERIIIYKHVNIFVSKPPQVFDATNTTRERRDLILEFAQENTYKVHSKLLPETNKEKEKIEFRSVHSEIKKNQTNNRNNFILAARNATMCDMERMTFFLKLQAEGLHRLDRARKSNLARLRSRVSQLLAPPAFTKIWDHLVMRKPSRSCGVPIILELWILN